jgi:hypothetical protein
VGAGSEPEELKKMWRVGCFLVLISSASGFVSAYYWYRSSRIRPSPAWKPEIDGDKDKNVMAWVTGNMIALNKSGSLNQTAALWAALAILSGAVASLISYFSR